MSPLTEKQQLARERCESEWRSELLRERERRFEATAVSCGAYAVAVVAVWAAVVDDVRIGGGWSGAAEHVGLVVGIAWLVAVLSLALAIPIGSYLERHERPNELLLRRLLRRRRSE